MKLFIASDIHGSLFYTNKMLEKFEESKCDYLVLLGDILYHGPRNGLSLEYDPKGVSKRLNEYKKCIIAVRGNCDAEVDQMMLEFPIMEANSYIFMDGKRIFLTHGHVYNDVNLPPLRDIDYLFFGHTHCSLLKNVDGITVLNPGSISFPKDGQNSYAIMENGEIKIYPLD